LKKKKGKKREGGGEKKGHRGIQAAKDAGINYTFRSLSTVMEWGVEERNVPSYMAIESA